ncbi:MAG: hypothetical protein UZ05_CHB002002389 [Chlorobi bacterium OLB5]|nr:MAG: hypothetical protein UZ05_CHB002002389 [Chlorobi bacterium OLB5]
MQQKEKDQAKEKGITIVEKVIAYDGLAVIVHPENPISELTMEQIKKSIYRRLQKLERAWRT